MPNYAYNQITCKNEENFNKLRSVLLNDNNEVDFNKIIPMPKTLQIEASEAPWQMADVSAYLFGGTELHEHDMDEVRDQIKKLYPDVRFVHSDPRDMDVRKNLCPNQIPDALLKLIAEPVSGYPASAELGKVLLNNMVAYGFTDWYDWSRIHWGTKWNAIQTEIFEPQRQIFWETAWSPSIDIVEIAMEMAEITALYEYSEEQITAFSGEWLFVNGKLTERRDYDSSFGDEESDVYRIYVRMMGEPDPMYEGEFPEIHTTDTEISKAFDRLPE